MHDVQSGVKAFGRYPATNDGARSFWPAFTGIRRFVTGI
jgi:hypothetical protein